MKRILLLSVPVLTILLFIFIMNSGFLFLEPGGYSLQLHIEQIRQNVMDENWASVHNEIERMDYMFNKKIRPIVQFSMEKDELMDTDLNISRIRGCVDSKDKSMALIYLRELEFSWNNLNS